MRLAFDQLIMDLDKLDTRFDALLIQADVYRDKVKKENKKEISELKAQIVRYQKEIAKLNPINTLAPEDNNAKIATTVGIFETILRFTCGDSDDFKAMLYASLFPTVYSRLTLAEDSAYFLEEMPDAAEIVIERGKEYLEFLRSECDEHLTNEEPWAQYHDLVVEWVRNDALPLIYQTRSEDWETDLPLTRNEIMDWVDNPPNRPMAMPEVFDALYIYRNRKDDIYTSSGIRAFELKMLQKAQGV